MSVFTLRIQSGRSWPFMPTNSPGKGLIFLHLLMWGYQGRIGRGNVGIKPDLACCLSRLVWVGRSSIYLMFLVWLSFARSLVVVPSLSSVVQSVVLGVASSGNQQCLSRCRSFELQASLLLRAPGYDETTPQYVLASRDRLDFEWGVLRSESRSRWSSRLVAEKLTDNRCKQMTSFVASDAVMYSASVLDRAVHSWSFELHDMTPPS